MEAKEEIKQLKSEINKTAILVALILGIAVLGFGLIQYLDKRAAEQVETERIRLQSESQRSEQEKRDAIMAECHKVAEESARGLLRTKSDLDKSNSVYRDAAEKGLFLKPDFDSYYEQCLHRNGIE